MQVSCTITIYGKSQLLIKVTKIITYPISIDDAEIELVMTYQNLQHVL
jgi:hypothetical protein